MNRPALKALFPYLLGGLFAYYLLIPQNIPISQFHSWSFSALFAIAGAIVYKIRRIHSDKAVSILLALSLFSLGMFRYQSAIRSPIPTDLYEQRVQFSGYVTHNLKERALEDETEEAQQGEGALAIFAKGKLRFKNKKSTKAKILVKYSPFYGSKKTKKIEPLRYGDIVEISGELRKPQGKRNPGGFDYSAYLARKGIFGIIYLRSLKDLKRMGEGGGNFWLRWMDKLRGKIERIFEVTMRDTPDYANVLKGIILGQKKALSETTLRDFRNSGVMHILAVSGLHVGMIALACFLLLKLFRIPEKLIYLLTAMLVIIYANLVGYRPSVVRASIIIILFFIAKIIDRDSDLLNLLGFAALLLLLFNHTSLWDAGFQLSFATTAAIVYLMSKWEVLISHLACQWERIRKIKSPAAGEIQDSRVDADAIQDVEDKPFLLRIADKFILMPLGVSIAAQVASQPIIAYHFNRIYPVAVLTNLVAVWLVWYIVCVAFVTIILSLIFPPIAIPFAWANKLAIFLLLKVVHFFAGIPYAVVEVPAPPLWFFIIYTASFFAITNLDWIRRRKKDALIIALAVISLCLWVTLPQSGGRLLEVTFLDVGQGDSAFIRFPDGANMLIDGGPKRPGFDSGEHIVAPFLRHRGIRKVDTVILTHPENDHGGGLEYILKNFRVGKIIGIHHQDIPSATHRKLRAIAEKRRIEYQPGFAGTIANTKYELDILSPTESTNFMDGYVNDDSVLLRLAYGKVSFLFTGDIEARAERSILLSGSHLQADIIKVPHHGSITSSGEAFLDAVNPAIAVISTGRRGKTSFASETVLERYKERHARVYRTDESGAIRIITDGRKCWMSEMNKEE